MITATVYIDTPILSRITDLRISEATAQAYAKIAKRDDIQLVTSNKTLTEVLKTVNVTRNAVLQFLVLMVQKVPLRTLHISGAIGAAALSEVALSGSWTDPLLSGLREIFDADDAEHVALAVDAGCNYFLTLDHATILSRVRLEPQRVRALCGSLEFVDPQQLAARLV